MDETAVNIFHVQKHLASLPEIFKVLNLREIIFLHLFLLLCLKFDDFALRQIIYKNFLEKYWLVFEILKHRQILYV